LQFRGRYSVLAISIAAPLLATLIAFWIETFLHRGNILLAYLSAVIIVAVRTNMKTALLSAVTSFLTYNFFFTEPRYSLIMMHKEDVLTVSLFMMIAALTGHQAVRLREQFSVMQARERFVNVQFEMAEKITAAIDKLSIYGALSDAVARVTAMPCAVVEQARDGFVVLSGSLDPQGIQQAYEYKTEKIHGAEENIFCDREHCFLILDIDSTAQVYLLAELDRDRKKSSQFVTSLNTLIQQAVLGLGRLKLVFDLQKERLEKEQELLRSALLSSVSHDLRTPLASMLGASSSLLELSDSLSDEQKRELLESILHETQRLDRYIQNLLDMTRLGRGELKLDRDWVAWEDILNVVIKRARPLLEGQTFVTHSDDDIPLLYVHPALIEQAIYNVLENAIKYSPTDAAVEINACLRQDALVIDISDYGPGIPEDEKHLVFDMFHTVGRGDRHPSSTGLGLAICKGMIAAHGGDVTVQDPPGHQGTMVSISLPLDTNMDRTMVEA